MSRSRFAFAGVWLFACLALVAGCEQRGSARGVVKGRVMLGDTPVTGATVFFENVELGVGVNAPLDANGNYEVKTYQGNGLPVGNYKVAVLPGGVMQPGEEYPMADKAKSNRPAPTVTIPERYYKTSTSQLAVEVKEGENPPFDFKLTP
jgi:hypothetical protein